VVEGDSAASKAKHKLMRSHLCVVRTLLTPALRRYISGALGEIESFFFNIVAQLFLYTLMGRCGSEVCRFEEGERW
jgi:hypothetical protein